MFFIGDFSFFFEQNPTLNRKNSFRCAKRASFFFFGRKKFFLKKKITQYLLDSGSEGRHLSAIFKKPTDQPIAPTSNISERTSDCATRATQMEIQTNSRQFKKISPSLPDSKKIQNDSGKVGKTFM